MALLEWSFPRPASPAPPQLPHLSRHSCQQPREPCREDSLNIQGFGDDPTQDGIRRLTGRFGVGWNPAPGTKKPVWPSDMDLGTVLSACEGGGASTGSLCLPDKRQRNGQGPLQAFFPAVLSCLLSEDRPVGAPSCNSSPVPPYPSQGSLWWGCS